MSKFKTDQKCILVATGEEVEILNVKKTFVPPSVKYTLKGSESVVEEKDLQEIGTKVEPTNTDGPTIEELRAKYATLYGKDVAKAYQNNPDWISAKIVEKEEVNKANADSTNEGTNGNAETGNLTDDKSGDDTNNDGAPDITVESLKDLDIDELAVLVEEKDLDLVVEDYNEEDLRTAIAQELGLI